MSDTESPSRWCNFCQTQHSSKSCFHPGQDELCRKDRRIAEQQATIERGLSLPKITPEIEDLLQGSYLIENGDWTQDAVEFVCILSKALGDKV